MSKKPDSRGRLVKDAQSLKTDTEHMLKIYSLQLDLMDRTIARTNAILENKDLNYKERELLTSNLEATLRMRAEHATSQKYLKKTLEMCSKDFEVKYWRKSDLLQITFVITCIAVIVYLLTYN